MLIHALTWMCPKAPMPRGRWELKGYTSAGVQPIHCAQPKRGLSNGENLNVSSELHKDSCRLGRTHPSYP
jgi:hypothetical protein